MCMFIELFCLWYCIYIRHVFYVAQICAVDGRSMSSCIFYLPVISSVVLYIYKICLLSSWDVSCCCELEGLSVCMFRWL